MFKLQKLTGKHENKIDFFNSCLYIVYVRRFTNKNKTVAILKSRLCFEVFTNKKRYDTTRRKLKTRRKARKPKKPANRNRKPAEEKQKPAIGCVLKKNEKITHKSRIFLT